MPRQTESNNIRPCPFRSPGHIILEMSSAHYGRSLGMETRVQKITPESLEEGSGGRCFMKCPLLATLTVKGDWGKYWLYI